MAQVGEWPQWINLFVGALSGLIIGIGTCVKWMWKLSDRVLTLEEMVGDQSVAESLKMDRHDHIYPMLQDRIILPLDMLEKEMKLHDKSLAILLERNRLEDGFTKVLREMANGNRNGNRF